MHFILIKTEQANLQYCIDVLKMLLGNYIDIDLKEDILKITAQYENQEIIDCIRSLENDLNTEISCYLGQNEYEYEAIIETFKSIGYGQYNLKKLIYNLNDSFSCSKILDYLLDSSGINEQIIISIARADLNISKASNILFMHRNTLLYKIERFYELKGFDLKSFWDIYLLVKLINLK